MNKRRKRAGTGFHIDTDDEERALGQISQSWNNIIVLRLCAREHLINPNDNHFQAGTIIFILQMKKQAQRN